MIKNNVLSALIIFLVFNHIWPLTPKWNVRWVEWRRLMMIWMMMKMILKIIGLWFPGSIVSSLSTLVYIDINSVLHTIWLLLHIARIAASQTQHINSVLHWVSDLHIACIAASQAQHINSDYTGYLTYIHPNWASNPGPLAQCASAFSLPWGISNRVLGQTNCRTRTNPQNVQATCTKC